MKISRVNPTFSKTLSGGGANFVIPAEFSDTMYGSGWPIMPVARPGEVKFPRRIDYPISVNATLSPRTGYGLMPFPALLEAYENVAECRNPVSLIWRELASFVPRLIDEDGGEVEDHPYDWLTISPDRKNPFVVWMTRFLKGLEMYDAPALFLDRNDGKGIQGLHVIDGATLFVIVDELGDIPVAEPVEDYVNRIKARETKGISIPPFGQPLEGTPTNIQDLIDMLILMQRQGKEIPTKIPAFTQIIKGTPYSWWSSDQIWYQPRSPRVNAPYGESFIEQAWSWVMILVNITAFELGHYRTGSMPEGFVTLPKDLYPSNDRIILAEASYNQRMTSNPATERMRLRFFPDGSKYIPTKKPDFPRDLYKQAFENVLHAIGIPPSEFGAIPGMGLGGKGFKQGAQTDLSRMTLNPRKTYIEGIFNRMLEEDGVDDATFELSYPTEQIDPEQMRQDVFDGMAHAVFTLNDALSQLNMNPVDGSVDEDGNPIRDHIANKHILAAGSSLYIYEDIVIGAGGLAVPEGKPDNQAGGAPVDPEDAVTQKTPHTPDDFKTLQNAIRNMIENGTLDGKKFSVPASTSKPKPHVLLDETIPALEEQHEDRVTPIHTEKQNSDGLPILSGSVSTELAAQIWTAVMPSDEIIDPDVIEQFRQGLEEEQEHAATVGNDTGIIANIVLDHLNEDPEYYSHLSAGIQAGSLRKPYAIRGKKPPFRVVNTETGDTKGTHGTYQSALDQMRALYVHVDDASKMIKLEMPELKKHCGLCPEDDDYFGAPLSREFKFSFPKDGHVNDVEIVAMIPPGLPPKPAIWKPEGGELPQLQDRVGGKLYPREEAAYHLDRSLNPDNPLVPVSYVGVASGERGAAIYYVMGNLPIYIDVSKYAPEWVERAAVFDYITSQTDRNTGNYLTHPDDPQRPVFIDNGLGFPTDLEVYCTSPFCESMLNKSLSSEALNSIQICLADNAMWMDLVNLIGPDAVAKAKTCAHRLLDEGMITPYEHEYDSTTYADA